MDTFYILATSVSVSDSGSNSERVSSQEFAVANVSSTSHAGDVEVLVDSEKNGTWCTSNYYCVVA
ncbi:hypothetical protein CPB83DRAFT_860117 [Crepidotus variabilis]|uniref:Uncharacterized protein n=1 Tax=Crepidotus variabilis TaxID=179855 RepID=A0A9P6JLS9_9AGAR|nr:hypothetical protein CPB83DRAFT_860117 [Crepidotus variabilis]